MGRKVGFWWASLLAALLVLTVCRADDAALAARAFFDQKESVKHTCIWARCAALETPLDKCTVGWGDTSKLVGEIAGTSADQVLRYECGTVVQLWRGGKKVTAIVKEALRRGWVK